MNRITQGRTRGSPGGFTLIEILIAVAAVALVSVGLAAIFDSVGKTVASGRRFSVMTQYAAQVENQLRRDIASMSPNSFLVVRQQRIANVPLARGAGGTGTRRADELLFFAEGDFASARAPIGAGGAARARAARVYYGAGARLTRDTTRADYFTPDVSFGNAPGPSALGTPGPNLYASEWTLLRHVTPLIQPRVTDAVQPDLTPLGVPSAGSDPRLNDSDAQIALQPAATSIFRHVNHELPRTLSNAFLLWAQSGGTVRKPGFATGIVDIATTDLEEIRATVVGTDFYPAEFPSRLTSGSDLAWPTQTFDFSRPGPPPADPDSSLDRQHAWMDDAFPTESQPVVPSNWERNGPAEADKGTRVRCEPQPVDLRAVLEGVPVGGSGTPDTPLASAYKRGDQLMLSAHNFMPRCSDFAVEWSFGRTTAQGELVWYGPPRGASSTFNDATIKWYGESDPEQRETYLYTLVTPPSDDVITPDEVRVHAATQKLIYGKFPGRDDPCVTSYFGYFDPTFDPANPQGTGTGQHAADNKLAPWPRPKLLRITMTLCDARDPKVQEQFQFVLDVPQRPQP